jgi:hypothetical protein
MEAEQIQNIKKLLETSNGYFIQHTGEAKVDNGNKLSIQGKTINDAIELFVSLYQVLIDTKCSFKIGTQKLIDKKNPQQSTKLFTVYIPNDYNVKEFAEMLYLLIMNYKGGQDIKKPDGYEHYANAIYFRNDRNEYGEYIPAN